MNRRTATAILGYGGLLLALAGGVAYFVLKANAESAARIDQYAASMGGRLMDFSPDYAGATAAGIVALIGVVMLIGLIIAAAARQRGVDPPAAP